MGNKRNVTLSVDEDIVKNAKISLLLSNTTMSHVLEEVLKSKIMTNTISSLASDLGIILVRINPYNIPKLRPKVTKDFSINETVKQIREV